MGEAPWRKPRPTRWTLETRSSVTALTSTRQSCCWLMHSYNHRLNFIAFWYWSRNCSKESGRKKMSRERWILTTVWTQVVRVNAWPKEGPLSPPLPPWACKPVKLIQWIDNGMKIKIKEHRENPSACGRSRGGVPVRAEAASGHPLWKLCFSSLNCIFFVFVSLFLEFTTIQLFNFVHSSCASDFLLYPLMIHSLDHTRRQGSCSGIRIAFAMLGLPSL